MGKKVGFTGTSKGMLPSQKTELEAILKGLQADGFDELHHGLCKGLRVTHCINGHEYTEENTIWRVRKSNGNSFRTCRQCHVPAHRRRNKRYRDQHLEQVTSRRRVNKLRSHFKITPEQYDQMEVNQNYVCAMCEEPETEKRNGKILRLSVDHDHETDEVRALLCKRCNRLLGSLNDSVVLFEKAIKYLKAHGKTSL